MLAGGVTAKLQSAVAEMGARVLTRTHAESPYAMRRASSQSDVRAAQALRFIVFNLELNEGLESSFATLRDEDRFDPVCDHLLVEDTRTGDVVGTYRLQTGPAAARNLGYYSAQEFDFTPFEPFRNQVIELGRACVHRDHRNILVLGLLWKGIADYGREHGVRYFVGCSSLTSQDPKVGASAFFELSSKHLVEPSLRTFPLEAYRSDMEQLAAEVPKIPKLLRAYLSLGAKICGPPAIDREFKTIDFLTWLDLEALPATARRIIG
jgi:putative hemolysin